MTASLGYTAFRLLYEDVYLTYAERRLGDRQAASGAVLAAFGALSAVWGEVLSSSSPAAIAWQVLDHAVCAGRPECGTAQGVDALRDVLPAEQADAVLIHRCMGMSVREAAALMGIEESTLAALLRMAERNLPRG
ncbi:sigma factor-like helix-turn-helix DNA-binding protein [Streptomyces lydicus]|uniref:sigma factor-like helix-turn-helix DNA-binding protein n=1 Tax=Streptomyces lydicus TaxID=47763 RepID=UPI00367BB620